VLGIKKVSPKPWRILTPSDARITPLVPFAHAITTEQGSILSPLQFPLPLVTEYYIIWSQNTIAEFCALVFAKIFLLFLQS
jgi:hypothetical protein